MKINDQLISDLGLNIPYSKGQIITISNCWHFYTDGNAVDIIFQDQDSFVHGMNRIYTVNSKYNIVIIAFCLMDNHLHFLLWGHIGDCQRFMHEYVKLTSMYISEEFGEKHKLHNINISFQAVTDDRYLKKVICYIVKNPSVAGIKYTYYDYPWSSGSLYFRAKDTWTSAYWTNGAHLSKLSRRQAQITSRTHRDLEEVTYIAQFGMIYPGEYVATDIVEMIFRTHKSFIYFMGTGQDIESYASMVSHLTIPIQEMRQNRDELCKELFGHSSLRKLDTTQRLKLAKELKRRFNCSTKQICRVSGLSMDETKGLL